MKIRTKFIYLIIIANFLLVSISVISIFIYQFFLTSEIGENAILHAEKIGANVMQTLYLRLERLGSWLHDPEIIDALKESNNKFRHIPDLPLYFAEKERELKRNNTYDTNPDLRTDEEKKISDQVDTKIISFYRNKYGENIYSDIRLMNQYGIYIVFSEKPDFYIHPGIDSLRKATENSIYITSTAYRKEHGISGVETIFRITDTESRFLGIMLAFINTETILSFVSGTSKRFLTTNIEFLTDEGQLLYANRPFVYHSNVSDQEYFRKIISDKGYFISRYGKNKYLYAYSRIPNFKDLPSPGWIVLIRYREEEILKLVNLLLMTLSTICIVCFIISITTGFFITRSNFISFRKLQEGITKIGNGLLDFRLDVSLKDEIGAVSIAFNNMLDYLKNVTSSRDELNIEMIERIRTEDDLRKTTEKFMASNIELNKVLKKYRESQSQLIQAEKMSSLGTLTAGIAHQMNNPLMSILNYIQYCFKHSENNGKIALILQDAELEVEKCIDIIRNLLAFSRMEAEGDETFEIADIKKIINQVIRLLSYKIETQKITLNLDIRNDNPTARIKTNGFQQVLINVITNAIYAVKNNEKQEISVIAEEENQTLMIKITDNGCGIKPMDRNRIFDPFYTTKPPGEGTGLGLSICKQIMNTHGGDILCESTWGKGSCFTIILPLREKLTEVVEL